MFKNYFEGYYFKHQKNNKTIAFIPGKANDTAFIQIITNDRSYNFNFSDMTISNKINIGNCEFSNNGINISLENINGNIRYTDLTPIKYDIMGLFKYFPMECRHSVISMHHKLIGKLTIDGEHIDFTGGTGYIEKDSGHSFPKRYAWLQCNDFANKISIMVSIADIPFYGLNFLGNIAVIFYEGKEYRLATYLGSKIICCKENQVILEQRKLRLEISLKNNKSHPLYSPQNGLMKGIIKESHTASAWFKFYISNKLYFCLHSKNTSFEYCF